MDHTPPLPLEKCISRCNNVPHLSQLMYDVITWSMFGFDCSLLKIVPFRNAHFVVRSLLKTGHQKCPFRRSEDAQEDGECGKKYPKCCHATVYIPATTDDLLLRPNIIDSSAITQILCDLGSKFSGIEWKKSILNYVACYAKRWDEFIDDLVDSLIDTCGGVVPSYLQDENYVMKEAVRDCVRTVVPKVLGTEAKMVGYGIGAKDVLLFHVLIRNKDFDRDAALENIRTEIAAYESTEFDTKRMGNEIQALWGYEKEEEE
jgi:hypothetical protein